MFFFYPISFTKNFFLKKGENSNGVFCGGNKIKGIRPLYLGKIAIDFCDSIILTSDNPRDEAEMTIIKEIQQGIPKNFKNLYLEKNRKKAIFLALKLAKKEDLVLVAGKGHEKFQTIKNKKIPFSDREVILEFFAKNGK